MDRLVRDWEKKAISGAIGLFFLMIGASIKDGRDVKVLLMSHISETKAFRELRNGQHDTNEKEITELKASISELAHIAASHETRITVIERQRPSPAGFLFREVQCVLPRKERWNFEL